MTLGSHKNKETTVMSSDQLVLNALYTAGFVAHTSGSAAYQAGSYIAPLAVNIAYTAGFAAYQAGAYIAPLAVNIAYIAGFATYQAGSYIAPLAVNIAYIAGFATYQAGSYIAPLAVNTVYTAGFAAYQAGTYITPLVADLAKNTAYTASSVAAYVGNPLILHYNNNQITPTNTGAIADTFLHFKAAAAVSAVAFLSYKIYGAYSNNQSSKPVKWDRPQGSHQNISASKKATTSLENKNKISCAPNKLDRSSTNDLQKPFVPAFERHITRESTPTITNLNKRVTHSAIESPVKSATKTKPQQKQSQETYKFPTKKSLTYHFTKHKKEFDYKDAATYESAALNVITHGEKIGTFALRPTNNCFLIKSIQ